jgi:hypothetical protein
MNSMVTINDKKKIVITVINTLSDQTLTYADLMDSYASAFDVRRLMRQRNTARSALRKIKAYVETDHAPTIESLYNNITNIERLEIDTDSETGDITRIDYVAGQSYTEELTNVMRQIINPRAKYVC